MKTRTRREAAPSVNAIVRRKKEPMPRTVDEGFRDFLTKLTPSATESQAARSHRASIEARLKTDFGLRRFVRIGLFGNGTSISGYSDVDYLKYQTSTIH